MAQADFGGRTLLILLDTDVLIQVTRRDPVAEAWFSQFPSGPPVPGIAVVELVIGSRNGVEMKRAREFVATLDVRWHTPDDNALAYDLVLKHKLSTGLGFADYLIAAQALNLNATLYTFNLKHFGAIPHLDAQAPYMRT